MPPARGLDDEDEVGAVGVRLVERPGYFVRPVDRLDLADDRESFRMRQLAHGPVIVNDDDPALGATGVEHELLQVTPVVDVDVGHRRVGVEHRLRLL
jgi:hypothetical protein